MNLNTPQSYIIDKKNNELIPVNPRQKENNLFDFQNLKLKISKVKDIIPNFFKKSGRKKR